MVASRAAGWASDSPTPAQLKELFAQIESGRITKTSLQQFLRGESDPEPGEWFTFDATDLTLNELFRQNPDVFEPEGDYFWKSMSFANQRGEARRMSIWTSVAPHSLSKTLYEQTKLVGRGEFVPSVRDIVEGVVAYYRQKGLMAFVPYEVRCLAAWEFPNGDPQPGYVASVRWWTRADDAVGGIGHVVSPPSRSFKGPNTSLALTADIRRSRNPRAGLALARLA